MTDYEKYQNIVDECREECNRCLEDYRKARIDFSPSACHYCKTGNELHSALMKISDAERKWGNLDWNSSRLQNYYHG